MDGHAFVNVDSDFSLAVTDLTAAVVSIVALKKISKLWIHWFPSMEYCLFSKRCL